MFGTSYTGVHRVIENEIDYINFADSKFKRCWLPKKCCVSGKSLWMRKAYKSIRIYRSRDSKIIPEIRWYDRDQFMMLKLKGTD